MSRFWLQFPREPASAEQLKLRNWIECPWKAVCETGTRLGKVDQLAQKIIIDADPGIGDALAVLTALVDPSLEVLALTGTAGSVSGAQATRNLQFLIDIIDPVKHPRVGQSMLPAIAGKLVDGDIPTRHSLLGKHGLGDLAVEVPDLHNRRESEKLIVDLVREFPHEVKILNLGPLTNIAAACDLDPELPDLLSGIVCLGGADKIGGDVTAVAEFNIWSDPEAARSVFAWPTTKELVPLDISSSAVVTFDDVEQLGQLTVDSLHGASLSSMLQFSVRANRDQLGCEGIPLHGVAALAVAAKAESFSVQAVRADIEVSGQLTRGMTVIDRRAGTGKQTNIDLVTSLDEHGVVDYFSRSYRRAAQ